MSGLSESEVASRLKTHGYNELPATKSKSIWVTAWGMFMHNCRHRLWNDTQQECLDHFGAYSKCVWPTSSNRPYHFLRSTFPIYNQK